MKKARLVKRLEFPRIFFGGKNSSKNKEGERWSMLNHDHHLVKAHRIQFDSKYPLRK